MFYFPRYSAPGTFRTFVYDESISAVSIPTVVKELKKTTGFNTHRE